MKSRTPGGGELKKKRALTADDLLRMQEEPAAKRMRMGDVRIQRAAFVDSDTEEDDDGVSGEEAVDEDEEGSEDGEDDGSDEEEGSDGKGGGSGDGGQEEVVEDEEGEDESDDEPFSLSASHNDVEDRFASALRNKELKEKQSLIRKGVHTLKKEVDSLDEEDAKPPSLQSNPLPVTTFASLGISAPLRAALKSMSITSPTEVQAACIPPILSGRDCIGNAKTGSGKTIAFALPILQKLLVDPYGIFALVLTPTRELAFQIAEQFAVLGGSVNVRTAVVVGGMDMMATSARAGWRPRWWSLRLREGWVDHREGGTSGGWDLSEQSKVLGEFTFNWGVLDEADRLLTPTFSAELGHIFGVLPKERQTCLFTATLTPSIETLAEAPPRPGKMKPFVHRMKESIETVSTLKQHYILVPSHVREAYLFRLLCNPPESTIHLRRGPPEPEKKGSKKSAGKRGAKKSSSSQEEEIVQPPPTIVFCSRAKSAAYLTLLLKTLGIRSTSLHSRLTQRERLSSLQLFKASVVPVLVSTDVGITGTSYTFSIPAKTLCIVGAPCSWILRFRSYLMKFLVAFFAQLFYASRIWKVGRLFESPFRWSVIPIVALALLQMGGGLIQVVVMRVIESKRFTIFNERVWDTIRSMYIHGAAAAACDILITIALVLILRSTGVNATRRTKSLLEKLVLYAINRGVVTSTLALLSILLYDLASGSLYYLIPFSSNTQVYVISVVSMLNSREGLRESMDRSFHVSDLMMTTTHKSGGTGTDRSSRDVLNDEEAGAVDSKCNSKFNCVRMTSFWAFREETPIAGRVNRICPAQYGLTVMTKPNRATSGGDRGAASHRSFSVSTHRESPAHMKLAMSIDTPFRLELHLPEDVWDEIVSKLEPLDVMALSKTCKTLDVLLSRRDMWSRILRAVCQQRGVFTPTYPAADMDLLQIQRAASRPERWAKVLRDNAAPFYDLAKTPQLSPVTPERPLELRPTGLRHLVPGGRFLIDLVLEERDRVSGVTRAWIHLWDLGIPTVTSQKPTIIASYPFAFATTRPITGGEVKFNFCVLDASVIRVATTYLDCTEGPQRLALVLDIHFRYSTPTFDLITTISFAAGKHPRCLSVQQQWVTLVVEDMIVLMDIQGGRCSLWRDAMTANADVAVVIGGSVVCIAPHSVSAWRLADLEWLDLASQLSLDTPPTNSFPPDDSLLDPWESIERGYTLFFPLLHLPVESKELQLDVHYVNPEKGTSVVRYLSTATLPGHSTQASAPLAEPRRFFTNKSITGGRVCCGLDETSCRWKSYVYVPVAGTEPMSGAVVDEGMATSNVVLGPCTNGKNCNFQGSCQMFCPDEALPTKTKNRLAQRCICSCYGAQHKVLNMDVSPDDSELDTFETPLSPSSRGNEPDPVSRSTSGSTSASNASSQHTRKGHSAPPPINSFHGYAQKAETTMRMKGRDDERYNRAFDVNSKPKGPNPSAKESKAKAKGGKSSSSKDSKPSKKGAKTPGSKTPDPALPAKKEKTTPALKSDEKTNFTFVLVHDTKAVYSKNGMEKPNITS
ncbi:hypothetical protein NMY22_g15146 [Coprinellus aureogranulatus]|nr:hypothetical protein NMY22_g15146 [Coprinellus aureogranulatus]